MPSGQAHWDFVYTEKEATEVSWYEAEPTLSLRLIEAANLPHDAALLDAGGGASKLAGRLAQSGYTDITVADLSAVALRESRASITAGHVKWVEADIREYDFGQQFELWHDRAVFHFMTTPEDRSAYLATLDRALPPGGHLILATFGPEGPTRCSGLPVARYGADEMAAALGEQYELRSTASRIHETPSGRGQQFVYARFQRRS